MEQRVRFEGHTRKPTAELQSFSTARTFELRHDTVKQLDPCPGASIEVLPLWFPPYNRTSIVRIDHQVYSQIYRGHE
jgi:hypothetical protein